MSVGIFIGAEDAPIFNASPKKSAPASVGWGWGRHFYQGWPDRGRTGQPDGHPAPVERWGYDLDQILRGKSASGLGVGRRRRDWFWLMPLLWRRLKRPSTRVAAVGAIYEFGLGIRSSTFTSEVGVKLV
jgi:hypothetical protein